MDKNKVFMGICILISAILISSVFLYSNNSNRYKVAGGRVFDTKIGKYVPANAIIEENQPKSTPLPTLNARDFETPTPEPPKGDISKVIISGKSNTTDGYVTYDISCTVKNNDRIEHKIYVSAIYYDKNNSPISTKDGDVFYISPGEMKGSSISLYDNIAKNISSYKLEIKESKYIIFK